MDRVRAIAHPSLALIKYWGKAEGGINLPAVPSLALTLGGLSTVTTARLADRDGMVLDGVERTDTKVLAFLDHIRTRTGSTARFWIESVNDFPTAAGLASSASGFAALAAALWALIYQDEPDPGELSEWARLGSGSACRSIFGGWTAWRARSPRAEPLWPPEFWPEVRVVLFVVNAGPKPLGSREGMGLTRDSSPFYSAWVADAPGLFDAALDRLASQDWDGLGAVMRRSYLRMFATMLGADPPVVYWLPASVRLIHLAQRLRDEGLRVWETMDAGPQVKYFCLEDQLEAVLKAVRDTVGPLEFRIARPGEGVRVEPCD
ncbi:MAG: diphosphomevalonate decarboxylase [Armatimonadota bacterium]|nr:diphosphomevalonate decarboxylase [Armatimonadota bacterium]